MHRVPTAGETEPRRNDGQRRPASKKKEETSLAEIGVPDNLAERKLSKTIGQPVNRYPSATPIRARVVRAGGARLRDDTRSFVVEGQRIVFDWTGQPLYGG